MVQLREPLAFHRVGGEPIGRVGAHELFGFFVAGVDPGVVGAYAQRTAIEPQSKNKKSLWKCENQGLDGVSMLKFIGHDPIGGKAHQQHQVLC